MPKIDERSIRGGCPCITKSVRIPVPTYDTLDQAADELKLSHNKLINLAVEFVLASAESKAAIVAMAQAR